MGISPMSNSSWDYPTIEFKKNPKNPNPERYRILKRIDIGKLSVILVKYHGCTNYEGKKIIVYNKVILEALIFVEIIDPHFSEQIKYSPIARFRPTDEGWEMAKMFAETIVNQD